MIRVKCNIHNWMHAWIGVLDHPYFAVTGEDGSFEHSECSSGAYTVAVWHEKLGSAEQAVTLSAIRQIECTVHPERRVKCPANPSFCSRPAAACSFAVVPEMGRRRTGSTSPTKRPGIVSIVDAATLNVVSTIPLGKRPRGIHASPDGQLIYVALSGSPIAGPGVDESTLPPPDKSADGIGIFDVSQNKLVRTIRSGSDPENFDVSKDGKFLYVSNEDAAGVTILNLDTERVVATIRTGEEPEGVKLTPDGKAVWVTSEDQGTVAVVDTAAQKLVNTIKVGRRPRSIAFTPDGARAYVNAENDGTVVVIDVAKQQAVDTIRLGEQGVVKPMAVLLSKDGSKLYVSTGRGHKVFIIDTAANRVDASIEVGQRPWGIGLSPDGKTLYSANGPSNDMSVVDLASRSVTRKVSCRAAPGAFSCSGVRPYRSRKTPKPYSVLSVVVKKTRLLATVRPVRLPAAVT